VDLVHACSVGYGVQPKGPREGAPKSRLAIWCILRHRNKGKMLREGVWHLPGTGRLYVALHVQYCQNTEGNSDSGAVQKDLIQ
jgi:hypothetical protein